MNHTCHFKREFSRRRIGAPLLLMAMLHCLVGSVRADDNAVWLKKETARQIAGCRIKSDSGVWLHTPDGIGHYKALWTRDYYYFVKYAGEFIDDANLKASIQYVLDGQREDGCIPDRVNADGKPIYSPGGDKKPLADHALDNAPFLALLACEHFRRTGDQDFFRRIEPNLRRGLDHVRRAENGLVYNPPANPQCVYGFTDIVAKTGHLLFTSLLYYQACVELDDVQGRIGEDRAVSYRARADLIRRSLPILWDDQAGMYLAADKDSRQIDIWGSAYAAEVGLASEEQQDRVADYLLAHWDQIVQHGQVRHLPGKQGWQRLFVDWHPVGSYINGAHWATPLPWVVPVVARRAPERAKEMVSDVTDDFQANGVAECINGDKRKVPNFVASVTNLYAASRWLATHTAAKPKPMNVIFITIDDLRPELATYKTDGILTPHIDRLAAKGLQFNAAYCQYPVCNSSRSSFLTGMRPDELGIFTNKMALRKKWPNVVTLPQLFRNNGYFTAGLGKLFHMGLDENGKQTLFRDDASFEYSFKAKGQEPRIGLEGEGRILGDGTVRWARWRAAEGGDLAQADGLLAANAVRLLNENRDKPFFIGVGFHKPHDPFVAPKEYFDLYPLEKVELAEEPNDRSPLLKHALPHSYNFATFKDRDRREFKRAYHACTTFVDAQVGKLLNAMDRLKLWDNTIVVLLGDHGYHLGEHGWWNKVTVFDIGARVPLVMWVPKSNGMRAETRAVVELLDLYPTLADLCRLAPPHRLQGTSLRPIVEERSVTWEKPAFTQVVRGPVGMGYSVRYGVWRLTQWGQDGSGGVELYNVANDKEGYYNRANDPKHAAILDRLYGFLKQGYPYIKRGSP